MRAFLLILAVFGSAVFAPALVRADASLWVDLDVRNWSKLHKAYGQSWLDHVNRLGPAAADLMAAKPNCRKLQIVDYSLYESKPPSYAVFFGECEGGTRVYVSEMDIRRAAERAYGSTEVSGSESAGAYLGLLIILCLYFLPAVIAHRRGHLNASSITLLNLLLGWTGLGWVAALVWSMTNNAAA